MASSLFSLLLKAVLTESQTVGQAEGWPLNHVMWGTSNVHSPALVEALDRVLAQAVVRPDFNAQATFPLLVPKHHQGAGSTVQRPVLTALLLCLPPPVLDEGWRPPLVGAGWPVAGEPWHDLADADPRERVLARWVWAGADPWRQETVQLSRTNGPQAMAPVDLALWGGYHRVVAQALRLPQAPSDWSERRGWAGPKAHTSQPDWATLLLHRDDPVLLSVLLDRGHPLDGLLFDVVAPATLNGLLDRGASATALSSDGLGLIDHWLKHRTNAQARALVQAFQAHPATAHLAAQQALTAAAVGGKPAALLQQLKDQPDWPTRRVERDGVGVSLAMLAAERAVLEPSVGTIKNVIRLWSGVAPTQPEVIPGVLEADVMPLLAMAACRNRRHNPVAPLLQAYQDLERVLPWDTLSSVERLALVERAVPWALGSGTLAFQVASACMRGLLGGTQASSAPSPRRDADAMPYAPPPGPVLHHQWDVLGPLARALLQATVGPNEAAFWRSTPPSGQRWGDSVSQKVLRSVWSPSQEAGNPSRRGVLWCALLEACAGDQKSVKLLLPLDFDLQAEALAWPTEEARAFSAALREERLFAPSPESRLFWRQAGVAFEQALLSNATPSAAPSRAPSPSVRL